MKCPICETEGCKKVEVEAENNAFKYKCVKCDEFYADKKIVQLLETDFIQVLRTNLGEDIILNKEKINTYRAAISEYIDTYKPKHLTFDTDNLRENKISIKKLLQIVHLTVFTDNNTGIFETLYSKQNGQYALFYDSESKAAWVEHLPDLPPGHLGTGIPLGNLKGIHSKEEAFKKLKEMVDKINSRFKINNSL